MKLPLFEELYYFVSTKHTQCVDILYPKVLRITPQAKALLQQAATLSGHTSLSGFISSVATQEARKIIRREEVTLISDEGMDYVIKLLNNPPQPNQNLKNLMSGAYRKSKEHQQSGSK